jgi:hypothetical protein
MDRTIKLALILLLSLGAQAQTVKGALLGGVAVGKNVCGPPNFTCASTSLSALTYPNLFPFASTDPAGTIKTDSLSGAQLLLVTDANTDPGAGSTVNTYAVSNGGGDSDSWFSSDDRLLFVGNTGGFNLMIGFNPSTLAISHPYSAVTSGCPRGNCSTHNGFSTGDSVEFARKASNNCVLYSYVSNATTIQSYTFGSDAAPTCSGAISGPPAPVTLFDFKEDSPAGCVGTACNCLPSDFGTPTWRGTAPTDLNDTLFVNGFSSVAYHFGAGTGQNTGIYAVAWSPGKGCFSWNTQTGVIHADVGWAGTGLTCTATQCTGTSTSPVQFTIHAAREGNNSDKLWLSPSTIISGTSISDNPVVAFPGTNIAYYSEGNPGVHFSGHPCHGALGIINGPGAPPSGWYYRTNPSSGTPGTAAVLNTLPGGGMPTNLDAHCGWGSGNANDTAAFEWTTTTASQSSVGNGLLPFDQPNEPWWNEILFTSMTGGVTHREWFTYNSGYSVQFSSSNNIAITSGDGRFTMVGTDGLQSLHRIDGAGGSCIKNGPSWASGKAYPANYVINPTHVNTGNNSFSASAGTASGTEPLWDSACVVSCSDGGVTWTNLGAPSGGAACRNDVILGVNP